MAERPANLVPDGAEEATDLEGLIGYNLRRADVVVRTHFTASLGADALSTRVFTALSLVVQTPKITQSVLARVMGIERSGLVAIVDDLEARGFVQRAPVPGDRRVQALVPTDAGRRAYGAALQTVRDHEDRLFSGMSEAEKQTLLQLLKKVRRSQPGNG